MDTPGCDLSGYIGQNIRLRFLSVANSSLRSDGFYFDDFRNCELYKWKYSSCTDGIQNGDETGVDCGGSNCPACPTCTDGIQNGNETGVDCGGNCTPCQNVCDTVVISSNNFETGFGSWVDGGTDCVRTSNTTLQVVEVFHRHTR
ncbi:MAG: hypothetical protein IPN72_24835 [Saprospiraceae bacterium]|nr:hypothetical protein [Saprospiraceae bacterium]